MGVQDTEFYSIRMTTSDGEIKWAEKSYSNKWYWSAKPHEAESWTLLDNDFYDHKNPKAPKPSNLPKVKRICNYLIKNKGLHGAKIEVVRVYRKHTFLPIFPLDGAIEQVAAGLADLKGE